MLFALYCLDWARTDDWKPLRNLSRKQSGSIPTPDSCILDLKTQNHVAVSVSIHISPPDMNRRCLSPCCTEPDRVQIYSGCVETVNTENRHTDISTAVGIDSISIAVRSNINGDDHGSLKLNCPDIADADTGISQLISAWTSIRISPVYK